MAKPYEPGEIVGGFEVIEAVGLRKYSCGSTIGIYRVRCRFCREESERTSAEMRSRFGCGCTGQTKNLKYIKSMAVSKPAKPEPWMEEGEIYRSWKEMRDRTEGVSILAQLNDVSEKVIEKIIATHQRQEAEASAV